MMLASIQDHSNEDRQITSLNELNMILSMGNGHVKIGEATPIVVKVLMGTRNLELVSDKPHASLRLAAAEGSGPHQLARFSVRG